MSDLAMPDVAGPGDCPGGDGILEVQDLHVTYRVRGRDGWRRRTLQAVDGVSLVVPRGGTLGLVGESGCGKSSLVRAIFGLVPASSGRVLLNGVDLLGLGRRSLRAARPQLQVVFQDPYASLDPRMTVHDIVAEPLRVNGRYRAARVLELLDQVGLPGSAGELRPAQFSGGQRQRIGIARALALEPSLVVLDEPVSALDKSIQAQILILLRGLQRELGLSYLFISHDLSVVRHMSDTVCVMQSGQLVETGDAHEVFASPSHPYTRDLIASAPVARVARTDRGASRD